MSDFKSFKKADLFKVAKKVGLAVRAKDTKLSLLEKIEQFIEESPEKARDLIESAEADDDDDDEEETATLIEENDATEDEDDDEEVEVEASVVVEEEEDEDKDYNAPPPVNLKEWVVDPAIDLYETAVDKVLAFTDNVGITTAEYNDDLRDSLSKTVTLNYLELAVEVGYFLYKYVPVVPVRKNPLVHQVFKDNIPYLNYSSWPSPDLTALWDWHVFFILGNWTLYAVAVPLLVSYYVNFSRRVVVIEDDDDEDVSFVVRLFKFDPFIFALVKVLIFYYIFKHAALHTLVEFSGILLALKSHLLVQLGLYHTFIVGLGNFPLVIGLANVAIGLYAQFEDY